MRNLLSGVFLRPVIDPGPRNAEVLREFLNVPELRGVALFETRAASVGLASLCLKSRRRLIVTTGRKILISSVARHSRLGSGT